MLVNRVAPEVVVVEVGSWENFLNLFRPGNILSLVDSGNILSLCLSGKRVSLYRKGNILSLFDSENVESLDLERLFDSSSDDRTRQQIEKSL